MKNLADYLDPPTPESTGERDGLAVLAMMRRIHRKQQEQDRAQAAAGDGVDTKRRKG